MNTVTSAMQPVFTFSGGAFLSGILLYGLSYYQDQGPGWLTFAFVLFAILYRMLAPVSVMNTARSELKGDLPVLNELQRFRDECAAYRVINGTQAVSGLTTGMMGRARRINPEKARPFNSRTSISPSAKVKWWRLSAPQVRARRPWSI
jgi:hypothetical protein